MAEELTQRITDYLASGGLFNPELANHDAVRDLLIDCRAALTEREGECERLREDAARLDWLELHAIAFSVRDGRSTQIGTDRAAIDAARGPRTGGGE